MPTSAAAAPPDAYAPVEFQSGSTVVGKELAKALSHPVRIRIVVELNKRVMSPPQFAAEFRAEVIRLKGSRGGRRSARVLDSSMRRYVRKQFQVLEELGCIEIVDSKSGGARRGAREHFYRAVQRTLFDTSVWMQVPDSKKGDVTATAFSTYIEQIAEALQGGTMDARDDRHFTWTAMLYDEQGWAEMIAEIEALFLWSLEQRIEAALRMADNGERPIPVTVGLACFESPEAPTPPALRAPQAEPPPSPAETKIVSQRLAKAMAHSLRIRILVELNKRPMSPTQFAWEIGGASLSNVSRHFRILKELGCIELEDVKTGGRRRGGREHFYRAVQRSLFDESVWANLPNSLRAEVTVSAVSTYIERVSEAIASGTMDSRDDRHFTWTAMHYDQDAWDSMNERIERLFKRSLEIQTESLGRLEQSDEEPIPVTVALACFESPSSAQLSPIPRLEYFRRALQPRG